MRYPGLAPAGSGPPESGWALAGSDLARAALVLGRPTTGIGAVQLAEVHRRRTELAKASSVLEAARFSGPEQPLLWLAEANLRWNEGDLRRAVSSYRAAYRAWDATGNDDGRLAAQLGFARCERITVGRRGGSTLEAARKTGIDVHDQDLLADLGRERAAWALIAGDHEAALGLAQAASKTHRLTGDEYLMGLADVLVARAWNAAGDENRAIGLLQEVRLRAVEIGSFDLNQLCVIYLGQFLQRGAAPDSARWQAAEVMLREEIGRAPDPITRAEMLLPLAHLHLAAGEFGRARDELDQYLRLYTAAGGNRVSTGNYYKAQARLELAVGGGSGAMGMVRRTPRLIAALRDTRRNLRRAARAYRDAGLEPGLRSIEWHLSVLDLMAAGRHPEQHLSATAVNRLDTAVQNLVIGETLRASGKWSAARTAYVAVETDAVACGSTVMAVAATAFRAEAAYAAANTPDALDAIRSMLRHSEAIRAAITVGPARGNVASVLRSHYERAAVLAARLGNADLTLELIERLRTERLAGLLRSGTQALPEDVQDLLTQIDDTNTALLNATPGVQPVRSLPAVEEMAGLAPGALAVRLEGLYAELRRRTSDLFADAVGAVPVDWQAIASVRQDVLALVTVPDGAGEVVITVWRSADGNGAVALTEVDDDLALLRDTLVRPGPQGVLGRVSLTSSDLTPVQQLLPVAFTAAVRSPSTPIKLVIVPTSWLWAIPFAGVPLGDAGTDVLVDVADVVLAPSLRFFIELTTRNLSDAGRGVGAVSWRAPDSGITAPEIDALQHHTGGNERLSKSADVREAFVRGGHRYRTAVLAAHGNREPGMAQAVLDGIRPVLSASDYLNGDRFPPRFLSLASCHSGYPDGDDPHEPLGLALAALTAGVKQVVTSTFEMDAYEGPATDCLRQLYADLAHDGDAPTALCRILREEWGGRRHTAEPLYRWAVLSVIGIHP